MLKETSTTDEPDRPASVLDEASVDEPLDQRTVSVLLAASRALVGVAARSLSDVERDLTLVQARALMWLGARDTSTVGALADALRVHPSTATRLCDRLVDKGLIKRTTQADDRREVLLRLAPRGRRIVEKVSAHRTNELTRLLASLDPPARTTVIAGLEILAGAAGELPDDAWRLGWSDP